MGRNDFPMEVLGGPAGDFALTVSKYLETPVEFLFMGYLTCLGTALSRRITLETELDIRPNMYVILVGESYSTKKSTAIKKTLALFTDVIPDFEWCQGIGSAEGLQNLLKESKNGNSPGFLLAFDEFKSFVSKCRIENSVLLPMVTSLFESTEYENHTRHKSTRIEDAHLSVLAASTIDTYQRIYDKSFIDIGFTNRIFLVTGATKNSFALPEPIPSELKKRIKETLKTIVLKVGSELRLPLTPEAKRIYAEWYDSREKSVHIRRLDTYALKLMMLLAVNLGKKEITESVIRNVLLLISWQLEIRKEHDPIDADNACAHMEELIRRKLRIGSLKTWELKRVTNANRPGLWIFNSALKNLVKAGEIVYDPEDKVWNLGK